MPQQAGHRTLHARALVEIDQWREMGARSQLAPALQRRERAHGVEIGPGVEEAGDALPAHRVQCGAGCGQVFFCAQWRQQAHRQFLRGVFQQAGSCTARVAYDLSARRIRRCAMDAGQLDAACIELHRMPERGTHEDRARSPQGVQRRRRDRYAIRPHPLLEPVDDDQPAASVLRFVAVEASLDARLELGYSQPLVIQAAVEQAAAARLRMHVGVDQARHQHASLQVDDPRAFPGQRRGTKVVAHVDDAPAAHGQGLVHAVVRVDGVDEAVAVDQVCGCACGHAVCMGCGGQRQHREQGARRHGVPSAAVVNPEHESAAFFALRTRQWLLLCTGSGFRSRHPATKTACTPRTCRCSTRRTTTRSPSSCASRILIASARCARLDGKTILWTLKP